MKISSISDVHLSLRYPERFDLFFRFLRSKEVNTSDTIILLGDIFDIMIGNKLQYTKKYHDYFNELSKLLNSGKKLIVVEGNHDFHTEEIYKSFFEKNAASSIQNYEHIKYDKILKSDGFQLYIGHGDILDYRNTAYKRWKKIYSSQFFKIFTSYIIPFRLVEYLGDRASRNSKKRSRDSFNYEAAKEEYRNGFKAMIEKSNYDIVLTGHTHILEDYTLDGVKLLNNGFFPQTKSFIYIEHGNASVVSLEEN